MSLPVEPCKGCNQLRPILKQPTPEDIRCEDCDLPPDFQNVFGFDNVWLTILRQQDEQVKLLSQQDEQIKALKIMVEKQ